MLKEASDPSHVTVTKPHVTHGLSTKRVYICGHFHDGTTFGKHHVVGCTAKKSGKYLAIIRACCKRMHSSGMTKQDAIDFVEARLEK